MYKTKNDLSEEVRIKAVNPSRCSSKTGVHDGLAL
jgi:hypothetical protein